jgi:hypothetical protein
MPPFHAVPGRVQSAGRSLRIAVLALVWASTLLGCGGESPVATAANASTASVSKEQRTFDAVAQGHAQPLFLKAADQRIAKAAANPKRAALWVVAFRGAVQAAQSGDGYEAGTGRTTKTGRAMLRVAIGFWDRYVGLQPRPLDDGTFLRMLLAFGDGGLRDLAGLRRRLEVVAPVLTNSERLTLTRVFPTLADVVYGPSSPDTAGVPTPKPFLKPAPTIRFHTEHGFKFALRMIGSQKQPDQASPRQGVRLLLLLGAQIPQAWRFMLDRPLLGRRGRASHRAAVSDGSRRSEDPRDHSLRADGAPGRRAIGRPK